MAKPKAIIIGGGISGLATANLLACKGYDVVVLEQSDQLGGRAGLLEVDGFRFDTGPSWYLMPEVFEHYFSLFGRKTSDYYQLKRLNPAYRIFPESGQPVTITSDLETDATTFDALEPGTGASLKRHVARAEKLYELATDHFLYIDRVVPRSFLSRQVLGSISSLPKSVYLNNYINRQFKHPVLRQILQYQSVFLGVSPYETPSLYALMAYLDFKQGVYYPQGGMYEVIAGLVKLGRELGVNYQTGIAVQHITTADGKARAVVLGDGSEMTADIVVSAADLHHTEQKLLSKPDRSINPKFWTKAKSSPSALLMYLGVKGDLPELSHHNLIFTTDWQKNFGDIFERVQWPHPASMYVSVPSKTDPSVAPAGNSNVFVLVPLPPNSYLSEVEQSEQAEAYLDELAHALGIADLKKRIVYKKLFGPADFRDQLNSWQGNALGLGHSWGQSAWFRPSVKSKKLSNMYYVGGSVRPGIGLPMCLISAQLVIKNLTGDKSAGPLVIKQTSARSQDER